MALKITQDKTADIFRSIDELVKSRVLVGIPDTAAGREPDPDDPNPPSNATIGYLMETGDDEMNLPARPFLVPGIENAQERITYQLGSAALAAVLGDASAVDASLAKAGLIAQASVRAEITDGNFAPLKERTIKARLLRGRTGTKPLIDTGQLRNAVTYVVARRGV